MATSERINQLNTIYLTNYIPCYQKSRQNEVNAQYQAGSKFGLLWTNSTHIEEGPAMLRTIQGFTKITRSWIDK